MILILENSKSTSESGLGNTQLPNAQKCDANNTKSCRCIEDVLQPLLGNKIFKMGFREWASVSKHIRQWVG